MHRRAIIVVERAFQSIENATTKERVMYDEERIVHNTAEDQKWADLLSPARRRIIVGAGLTAAGLTAGNIVAEAQGLVAPGRSSFKPIVPPPDVGKSPCGYETYKEPT